MNLLQRLPIQRKLVAITLLASTAALLAACAAFVTYEQITARKRIVQELTVTAEMTGLNSAAGLTFNEPGSVEQSLQSLRAQPNIVAACIYDLQGHLFAHYQRDGTNDTFASSSLQPDGHHFSQDRLELFQTIKLANEPAGTIYLSMDLGELNARIWRYMLIVALVLPGSALLALFLAARWHRVISEPLKDLARTVTLVAAQQNYSVRAVKTGEDEVGRLIDGFNHMLAQIQSRDRDLEAARETLERRVQERTQELARSLAVLHATLESAADGVLAVDRAGQVVSYNRKFAEMWGIPAELLQTHDRAQIAAFATAQTRDPVATQQRIAELQTHPETEAFDVLELKDGRVFERFVKPQRVGEECVGSVLNFRDVTERRRAEETLRRMEELYRRVIAGANAVPYAYDYQARSYPFMGEGIERLIGYRPEEINGELWKRIIQETVMRGETAGLSKEEARRRVAADELRSWRCDMRVLTRDGRTRWLSDASVQNYDAHGQLLGSMGILQDITDRKAAEAELAYQRDLLRTLLDNLPDSIYFKDLQSRFVHYSKSLPRHFNQAEPEAMRGKTDADFFTPEHARPALEDEQAIIRTGQPMQTKVERETHADGRITWSLTSKMPWRDKDGHIIGTFGISKDITEIKEAEAKLEAVHSELVAASRQAGMAEVATSVLHNVGNVLNSVNVSASLISQRLRTSNISGVRQTAALLEKHRERLAAFLGEPNRAEQLLAYLGSLARQLEAEQAEVLSEAAELVKNIEHIKEIVALQQNYAKVCGAIEMVSLPALVEDALRMHLEALARHQVRVVREFETVPELPLDKHKVLQILVNLISNAQHALAGSTAAERRLTLRLRRLDADRVCIAVCDNGMGIAPENLTRIFSHGFTTRPNGHGFGLHSGALAAREMGGALRAHSDGPQRGATFTLELPVDPEHSAHEP